MRTGDRCGRPIGGRARRAVARPLQARGRLKEPKHAGRQQPTLVTGATTLPTTVPGTGCGSSRRSRKTKLRRDAGPIGGDGMLCCGDDETHLRIHNDLVGRWPLPLLCFLSLASTIVTILSCWPGFAEFHFVYAQVSDALVSSRLLWMLVL